MIASITEWAWPWWIIVVGINLIQLVICLLIFKKSIRNSRLLQSVNDKKYLLSMRIMGLVFTSVAVYRSIFVSRYVTQMAWFDTYANSALIIRSLAIFAELSFSGLFALALLRINKDLNINKNRNAQLYKRLLFQYSPYILFACIFIAQFFATMGLITKNLLYFAIEETLWTVAFLSVIPLALVQLKSIRTNKELSKSASGKLLRQSIVIIAAWCIGYCSYGLFYHLPFENWKGALLQIESGIPVIKSGYQSISDAFFIVNESKSNQDWGMGFLFWHSMYFTLCVWITLLLMQAPRKLNN